MADVYGVYHDDRYNDVPPTMPPGRVAGNKVRVIYDSYEAAAAAAGTVIHLGVKLPKGTIILPETKVLFDALGASTTLAGGIDYETATDVPTALFAATSSVSAGVIKLDDVADIDIVPYELTDEGHVILTTAGGAITGTIKLFLYFATNQ